MLMLVLVGCLGQSPSFQPMAGSREDKTVYVTIESDVPEVRLVRYSGSPVGTFLSGNSSSRIVLNTFQDECTAPCEKHVFEPQDRFYIFGSNINASGDFSLMGHGESVRLKVHAGSPLVRILGIVMVILGPTALVTGGTYLLVDALINWGNSGVSNPYSSTNGLTSGLRTAAWGTFLGGAAATVSGIPLIAFSGTRVEVLPGLLPSKAAEPRGGEL